jgi:hypothetical protein
MMFGCHPADCEHAKGPVRTERNIKVLRRLLSETGLASERLLFDRARIDREDSVSMALTGCAERLMKLGPAGIAEGIDKGHLEERLRAAIDAAGGKRLKWLVGREEELVSKTNKFGETVSRDFYDGVTDDAARQEYLAGIVSLLLKEKPMSVKELASEAGLRADEILLAVMHLRSEGKVGVSEQRGKSPIYQMR